MADTDSTAGPRTFSLPVATQFAASLVGQLGADKSAGWYYEHSGGKVVVNVTDQDSADRVTRDGAVARVVTYSAAQLDIVQRKLGDTATIPGTSWHVDPRTDKVSVTADRTVVGRKWDQLTAATRALGGAVTVKRSAGKLKEFAGNGGDSINSGSAICSLGFNVIYQGAPAFLTAGHCGEGPWDTGLGQGTVVSSGYPRSDYELVKYDAVQAQPPSAVNLYNGSTQPITQAVEATVGMKVQRSGQTSGLHGGTVIGLNATANYESGSISGLIDTDVCAEDGDSGGALFSGNAAVGLTSGGGGDCSSGGETFFQPVTAALQATGAQLGSGGGSTTGGAAGSTVSPSPAPPTGGGAGGSGGAAGAGAAGSGGSAIGDTPDCPGDAIGVAANGSAAYGGGSNGSAVNPPGYDDAADWSDYPSGYGDGSVSGDYPSGYADGSDRSGYSPGYDDGSAQDPYASAYGDGPAQGSYPSGYDDGPVSGPAAY
ncbi:S1 family peptidase [Streptomyces actinomycinicus]|nr:S1 family peptidase [Streptomyces actinomycinicus]